MVVKTDGKQTVANPESPKKLGGWWNVSVNDNGVFGPFASRDEANECASDRLWRQVYMEETDPPPEPEPPLRLWVNVYRHLTRSHPTLKRANDCAGTDRIKVVEMVEVSSPNETTRSNKGDQDMDSLTKLKKSHAKLTEQLREARRVIMLYRRWEHADDVESITGDRADTERMLTDASFAAQDFVEKWENKITTI